MGELLLELLLDDEQILEVWNFYGFVSLDDWESAGGSWRDRLL